jgi:addiction module HigA family antidote
MSLFYWKESVRAGIMSNEQTPGQLVRDAMDAKGWNQSDLAFALGTTTAAVNLILKDKRSISHNMAQTLAVALDKSAELFARAQAEWDVRQADKPDPAVLARARILARYPLREMLRRGWIDADSRKESLEQQVCRFFGVQNGLLRRAASTTRMAVSCSTNRVRNASERPIHCGKTRGGH